MKKKRQTAKYIAVDLLSAAAAWILFYIYRKEYIEPVKFGYDIPWHFDQNFYLGLLFVPLFWLVLYTLSGSYSRIYRKNRIKELGQTLLLSLIGVTVLFFAFVLDDTVPSYKSYYHSFLVLFALHFGLTFLLRLLLTSSTVKKIHNRKIGFNTLLIGGNEQALKIYEEIEGLKQSPGNRFIGFVSLNGGSDLSLEDRLPHLGRIKDVPSIVQDQQVEEIIIAIESSEHEEIQRILNQLETCGVMVKIPPDMYDFLSGSVKMTSILGAPLIEINPQIMPDWQRSIKRILDIVLSMAALALLLPLFLVLAVLIKATSKGPVIYKQKRVGLYNKSFYIYKFRSMVQDAEKDGPKLSSKDDPRVTKVGRFMRRTRMDELPQFVNVIKGEMSLVGPRPERQHFIDKITERSPHYKHLLKVKPGITSWGMVKFGYAENVDEMIERSKYDILYIENMSLAVDLKIMIYTVLTILKGTGR